MAPRLLLLLRAVVVLLLLGASASAGAAPPCPSSPPSVDWVQGLARRASVVIEGKVLAHSVVEPGGGGGGGGDVGGGEEATSLLLLLPSPPLLTLPEQQQQPTAASASSTTFSGTVPSPAPRALVPSPSPPPPPVSWVTRVRVHQVWPAKSGGLRKDGLLWVLLAERGSACGSSLKEESRYIFFMEPVAASSLNATGAPSLLLPPLLPSPSPLFRASSPPLETGRSLKKEVSRALCTRGCGNQLGAADSILTGSRTGVALSMNLFIVNQSDLSVVEKLHKSGCLAMVI